jgi:MFS family permease
VGLNVVDAFMVAAIMPSVVEDIGGAAFYTWSAMLYTVTATLGTACGGFAAAVLGLRPASLIGVLLLLLGNAGAALSPNMVMLLVARAVQGLGGGLLVAQAYGMASTFYPEALRARVLTTISVAHGLAALVGPIAGGGFAAIGWWRGAFWVAVPVLMVLAALMWRFLPAPETDDEAVSLPLLRLTLLGAAVLAVAASGQVGSLAPRLACVASAVILVKLTLRLDAGAATHLFPARPFSATHVVGTALPIILLFTVTIAHTGVFMPLVVQVLHGVTPLWAGYFQAVLALSWTTVAVASAGLEGHAVRRAVLVGPLLVAGGVLGQALLVVDGSLAPLAACIAMTGAGMGLCFAHISSWTMSAARTGEGSVTASAIPTVGSLGRGFGAASAGLVANVAGLGAGISQEAVASAAVWVYGLAVAVPVVVVVLSFRLLALHRVPR